MPSPYQEFVAKARARRAALQAKNQASPAVQKTSGDLVFTRHSEYKMKQYGLSLQKVRGVIRRPQRREVGIVLQTVAVMQPVNPKTENGKTTWKQEVWVLYKEDAGKKKIKSVTEKIQGKEYDWKIVTADGKLSAQWEHTVLITENGNIVLTKREEEQILT